MPRKKNGDDNYIDSKAHILDTAVRVFAEKGFDGARVDEIAAQAGIPKSLIYYHFKGKDHLLQELLERFLMDYREALRSKASCQGDSIEYRKFLQNNSDLLRVLMIESLKKNTRIPVVFKVVEILLELEKELYGEKELDLRERHKRLVAEFFTGALPIAGFICYSHAWCEYFKINMGTLHQDFYEAISKTHGAYHREE